MAFHRTVAVLGSGPSILEMNDSLKHKHKQILSSKDLYIYWPISGMTGQRENRVMSIQDERESGRPLTLKR